uniref:Uncharacterized protein n=1 Tax=Arundo donax TaxID=35708 RepID=A0A0A9BW66_ARUDO
MPTVSPFYEHVNQRATSPYKSVETTAK